jgi:putative DNA primase/helicase
MNNKPICLPVQFEGIPLELKKTPRWVLWRLVEVGDEGNKRWSKLPMQTTGQAASSTNPATWTDFISVQDAYTSNANRFDGIGFVFSEDDNLVGIDLDDVYDHHNARFTNAAMQQLADDVHGYMEVSPSGTGVKIFTRSQPFSAHTDHAIGFEAYSKGRYFTVTGHKLSGSIPSEPQDLTKIIPERTMRATGDAFGDYTPPLDDWDIARVESELLANYDDYGYESWLKVGMIMHHQFGGDIEACEAWDRWSSQGENYHINACENKWRTFKGKGGATLRSLIFLVNAQARKEALARGEIVLDSGAMNHARTFLDNYYSSEEGYRLVHYADDFYIYVGTHYEVIEEQTVRSKVYAFLDKCKKPAKQGALAPFNPSPASVSGAIDAIKSIVHLANHPNTKPPIWLEDYSGSKPSANKLVSLKNGIFHLEDNILIPHSLGFFTQNSLPFEYNQSATCPTWDTFLQSVWPDDQESIDTLQEMFGYILSGDTRQQKFFNIIGPRRSGKGTINKVLVALLGQHNTVAPELGELCDTFGLQPWLGKLLASFTDARAPERNRSAVVSQLLRIVGGDTITVNRKNKEAWNGYLPTRLVIYSNEVLQLTENSNALTGRMIVLKMTRSFWSKEDTELSHKLEQELGGVFNWAMEGLKRRIARGGHFIQPQTGKEYLDLMAELGNPIGTFAEDALIFQPGTMARKEDVFACYKHWALKKSMTPGTEQAFKRRFLAATQEQFVRSDLVQINGERANVYLGIKLNDKAQKYLDSIETFDEGIF